MKIFAIRDASIAKDRDLGWLLYYPVSDEYHIEICDGVDEWEAPLLISSFVKRGKKSLDPGSSRLWAELRVIPPDRQNLGMILRANGLREYDPFRLLVLAEGRCAQDDCFLVPLKEGSLPAELSRRLQQTILSCIPADMPVPAYGGPPADMPVPADGNPPAEGTGFLFFFRDGMVRRISAEDLLADYNRQQSRMERLACYYREITRLSPEAGGHGVRINEKWRLSSEDLRRKGSLLPVTNRDFYTYIQDNIIDTSTATSLLRCSRQNILDLVKRGKLKPVLTLKNNYLFLREEIFR